MLILQYLNIHLGSYPQNYNYALEERRFLANVDSFQSTLSNFPKNDTIAASKRTCKFVASYERYLIFKNKSCNVDNLLDENRRKAQQQEIAIIQRNQNVAITLIDSARYLCCQDLAFRREPSEEGKVIKTVTLN
ncbi:unnamed protein product [Rotaria sp. Silwood2]|nr:unnamed protein product [Rotaria sp. Silwood2]